MARYSADHSLRAGADKAKLKRFLKPVQIAQGSYEKLEDFKADQSCCDDCKIVLPSMSPTGAIRKAKLRAAMSKILKAKRRRMRRTEGTKISNLATLLAIKDLLKIEFLLKSSYSENRVDLGKLAKTLARLMVSDYLRRSDMILLVPSLIRTLMKLSSKGVEMEIRSRAEAVLTEVWKVIFPNFDPLDKDEIASNYFAQSSAALEKCGYKFLAIVKN